MKEKVENLKKKSYTIGKNRTAGITLVALVVTIVIMLILAGVSISLNTGNSSIFDQAQKAKEKNKIAQIIEYLDLKLLNNQTIHYFEGNEVIIRATQKEVEENKKDLLKIGDEVEVKEVEIDTQNNEVYFYVVVDKGVYKVTLDGTKYIGEQSEEDIIIEEGDIEYSYSPSKWTNGNVKVGIKANKKIEGARIVYKVEGTDTWTNYTEEIEVKKNSQIYAKLTGIMGETSIATGTVANIDKLAPLGFTPTITTTTNSISIEASTKDQEATLENGCSGIEADEEFTKVGYSFSKDGGANWTEYQANGNYTFDNLEQKTKYTIQVKVTDKAGNDTVESKEITTGEVPGLQTGDVTFTYDPSTWTNGNVKVTITGNNTGFTLQYKTSKSGASGEVANWTNYNEETGITSLTRNQDIYARVVDSTGQNSGTYATGTIANIDKLAPNSFTPTLTPSTNSITVTASTTDQAKTSDNGASGIKEYSFSINGGSWSTYQASGSYTFNNLTQNTNYTVQVKAKDNAGNETIGSQSVTTGTVPGLQTGDVTFGYSPSGWTNGNVAVTIIGNNTGFTLQYKTSKSGASGEVADWTNYTGAITLTRNQDIYARVVDSTGQNSGTHATGTVANIDKLAPNSFIPTLTPSTNSITVTASATDQAKTSDNGASGIKEYSFSINGGSWSAYQASGSYTYNNLKQKTSYTVQVRVKDKAGNETIGSKSVTTGTVPGLQTGDVTFNYSPSGWTKGDVKVTITGNNTGYTLQYKTEKSGASGEVTDWKNYTGAITLTRNQDVYARVVDSTGQNSGTYATGSVRNIDKTAPATPAITNPTNENWTNTDFSLTLKSSDVGSGISYYQYSYDQQNWNTYANSNANTFTTTPFSAQRNQLVYIRCFDYAGNVSGVSSTYIRIDKTGPSVPTVTYNGGSNSCSWKNNYNITLSSTDPQGIAYYESDGNGDGIADFTTGANFIPWNGFNCCNQRFRAVDNLGNRSGWTDGHHIHMDTEAPGKTSVNLNGYSSGSWTNGNVTQSFSATDNIGISYYQYSHDAVNPAGNLSSSWTINWDGQWNFYIRAVDHAGNVGAWSDMYTIRRDTEAPTWVSAKPVGSGDSAWGQEIKAGERIDAAANNSTSGIARFEFANSNGGSVVKTRTDIKGDANNSWYGNTGDREIMPANEYWIRAVDNAGNASSWVKIPLGHTHTASCYHTHTGNSATGGGCYGSMSINSYTKTKTWGSNSLCTQTGGSTTSKSFTLTESGYYRISSQADDGNASTKETVKIYVNGSVVQSLSASRANPTCVWWGTDGYVYLESGTVIKCTAYSTANYAYSMYIRKGIPTYSINCGKTTSTLECGK